MAKKPTILGHIFSTPVFIRGLTGFPLIQAILFWLLDRENKKRHPEWKPSTRWITSVLGTILLTGSEWCHNLAHAAAAHSIAKPVDGMRVLLGTPILIYNEINDLTVTPRQHIWRALGGPIFNLLVVPFAALWRRSTRPATPARQLAEIAVGTNLFIGTVALLPIPGIDGGPITKWSLVQAGKSPRQADELVKQINRPLGAILAGAAAVAFHRRAWLAGIFLSMLSATALAISSGIIQEEKVNAIR